MDALAGAGDTCPSVPFNHVGSCSASDGLLELELEELEDELLGLLD